MEVQKDLFDLALRERRQRTESMTEGSGDCNDSDSRNDCMLEGDITFDDLIIGALESAFHAMVSENKQKVICCFAVWRDFYSVSAALFLFSCAFNDVVVECTLHSLGYHRCIDMFMLTAYLHMHAHSHTCTKYDKKMSQKNDIERESEEERQWGGGGE